MNRIQILRGNIETYLQSNKLFDGQMFIQETAPSNGFYIIDAVTGNNIVPQPGDLYVGISLIENGNTPLPNGPAVNGITRVGSSRTVLNNFHLKVNKNESNNKLYSYIDLDANDEYSKAYAQNFVVYDDLIPDSHEYNWSKFREGQLYVYADKKKYTAPEVDVADAVGFYTIDKKPAILSEKDAFILLGELPPEENKTHSGKFLIIKLTGGSDGSNIEIFPDDPIPEEENIVDQVHAFFKDKTLIDSLYDIDRLKLSHYESQDPAYAAIPFSCNAFENDTLNDKLYIVNKTTLLKNLVSWYTGIAVSALEQSIDGILSTAEIQKLGLQGATVLDCAIARIQGTEFHIIAKQRTSDDGDGVIPQNLPFFIVTDDEDTIRTAFVREENKYVVDSSKQLHYIEEFGPKNATKKKIPAFFPGDEIVVKIKPAGSQDGQKPSEHQHDDGHYIMAFDINTEVEITRRGDISNPVLTSDDVVDVIDPEKPSPWGDRVNSVTTAYWKDHDQTLLTANDVIKDLRKTKADVDESGHIFTSQLPKTVIGGLQRRGSLNTEQLYAFLLGCTYTEGAEPDSIDTKLADIDSEVKAKIIENLKSAKIVGYTDGTERDAEGNLAKLIPNIDVGDYFIYSGNKIKLLLDNESYDESDPSALPYKLNDIDDDPATTSVDESYNNDIKFGELHTTSKVAGILDSLIKDGDNNKGLIQNKSFWLNPGDLIIIDDITHLDKAVHNVDDELDETKAIDTEDGFVRKISIIAGSENSVSGIAIGDDPEPVTGQIKLEPKHRGPGNETTIEKGENSRIIIGNNAVLWKNDAHPGTEDWGDNYVTGTISTIAGNGYARKTNERIKQLDNDDNGLIHEIINAYRSDDKNDVNGFFNVQFRTDASQSPVLNLGLTKLKTIDGEKYTANFIQKFQANRNGTIALLEDVFGEGIDDVEKAKAKDRWHTRYHTFYDEEAGAYRTEIIESNVRFGEDSKETEGDNKSWTWYIPSDKNFFLNEGNSYLAASGMYQTPTPPYQEGGNPAVSVEKEHNFVLYDDVEDGNGHSRHAAFVIATKENQGTSHEGMSLKTMKPSNEDGGLESKNLINDDMIVQTIPLQSGVLLNSNSIIDCGEWV